MAELAFSFDASDFIRKSEASKVKVKAATKIGLRSIAQEVLRLSQLEVPFVTGELLSSGTMQEDGEGYIVGYNKPYAAYQHEGHRADGSHVIKKHSNNRKGKYLLDPMKRNKEVFRAYLVQAIKEALR